MRPIGRSRNAVRVLAATLVPEHCRSGHCGNFCRWSHHISSATGQPNCWRLLKVCPASLSVKARFFLKRGGLQSGSGTTESCPSESRLLYQLGSSGVILPAQRARVGSSDLQTTAFGQMRRSNSQHGRPELCSAAILEFSLR
jgi:hypothetical protein